LVGGPSGMIAAISASKNKKNKVTIIEKMPSLRKKVINNR
jgi:predicted flavoprotein YhiN